MAWRRHQGDSRANDDSALAKTCQHHAEQLALAIGRAGDKPTIAGHHIEFCDVVDLRTVMMARIADTADAERSTDGDSHTGSWVDPRGQTLGKGCGCYVPPECARLDVHAFRGGARTALRVLESTTMPPSAWVC